MNTYQLTHLEELEAEGIQIIREVVAQFEKPVMLFSIGKDSIAMLRLAEKAFAPGKLPFPLLHVNTTFKFKEMISFRDEFVKSRGHQLIEWINQDGVKSGITPFNAGTQRYTHVMKTEALKQALSHYGFDAAFGGARRDEEKSRAKERVFSFRDRFHQWDPKNQRPELWNLYNPRVNKGESMRVFPLSNWTELDVWLYSELRQIPMVPLYFAATRPVVVREGQILLVDDERMRIFPGERVEQRRVRFRTLGAYPLTAGSDSDATSVREVIAELQRLRTSERSGRMIDRDEDAAMERKKREGYF